MRRPIVRASVLALLLAVGASACGSSSSGTAATTTTAAGGASTTAASSATTASATALTGLVKAGTLTVGTELPAPPFFNGDDYATLKDGFEYDLAAAIAKKAGLPGVTIVNMPFTGIVAGQKCPCDIDFSQITITEERKKAVSFTTPYFDADQGLLVNKGTTVADLAAAKKLKFGAQASTTGFDKAKELTGSEPKAYDTTVAAFAALKAKQIDAVVLDLPIIAGEAAKADSPFAVAGKISTGEQYGAIVPKDSKNLAAFDTIIKGLVADGTVKALLAKYFPAAASATELK